MLGEQEKRRNDVEIVSIESLVPEDHLLRKVDAVLEDKYLYELVRPLYSSGRGRKSIDPVVLIKMVLIQHLYGIRSIRQTAKEAEVNIAYRWFLGMDFHSKIPHFSTISYAFSKRFTSEIFEEIFTWILEKAIGFGYVEPETVFIDATHIKACANNYKKRKKIAQRAARVYEKELMEEINAERKEAGKKPFDDDGKPPAEREVTESTSDPESGIFRKGEHKTVFAYSAHTACDQNNFILEVEVTAGNEHDSTVFDEVYDQVTEEFPEAENIVVDAGYKTPWICKKVMEDGRQPVMPYSRPKGQKTGYRPREYRYNPERDCVICPMEQELKYSTTSRDGYRQYKSNPKECRRCPEREQCTRSRNCQKVAVRHIWSGYVEEAERIRLTEEGKALYRQRSQTIERVFADAKEKHAMRYTYYRGLERVQNWVRLKFACMNLKKMAVWAW